MIKLTTSTLASLNKIAWKVFEPGSIYLNEKESELDCTINKMKSARVQLIAIKKTIGNLRLFTTDPLGTISLETLMIKNLIFYDQVVK